MTPACASTLPDGEDARRSLLWLPRMHFSGHGTKSLYFEDGRGGPQVIDKERLKSLLQAGSGGMLSLEFVFVAACHSHETSWPSSSAA